MQQLKIWLAAARLRTLPLSISGILVGNAICIQEVGFSWGLFFLMFATAVAFQIISNFANDYGDGVKGTDNAARVGPKRVLQQGLLTPKQLKKGIVLLSVLVLFLSISLTLLAFGIARWGYVVLFLMLAALAVWAAIKYTVGENAYGYRGWGDFFVLLFFGGVSVLGAAFVQLKIISTSGILLSFTIGLLSVGVLNLNNMRDHKNDKAVGKNTMAVLLGEKKAKFYHYFLLIIAMGCLVVTFLNTPIFSLFTLPILGVIPILGHLYRVGRTKNPEDLDPELKKLALSTFFIAVLIFITFLLPHESLL